LSLPAGLIGKPQFTSGQTPTPLGTVQASITADDLSSIALTVQAVSVRFQYVIVVGH